MAGEYVFNRIKAKSTVDLLIDQLTQAIIDGIFKPGERIPTEAELADSFGVGRNSVREAIRTLVSYGILEIRRPSGTFVCDTFNPKGINPMLYGMILQKASSFHELTQLRQIIDIGIMLVLWERHLSTAEKKELTELTDHFKSLVETAPTEYKAILEADIAFHNRLAELTGNSLVQLENDMITRLTYSSRLQTIQTILQEGNSQYLINTHYNLLAALQADDLQSLYRAVQDSYFYWKDTYKQGTAPSTVQPPLAAAQRLEPNAE